jgi:hypothetical protein
VVNGWSFRIFRLQQRADTTFVLMFSGQWHDWKLSTHLKVKRVFLMARPVAGSNCAKRPLERLS